jgi:hypothetical protein
MYFAGLEPEHRDIPPGQRKACCGVRRARRGRNIEKSLHNGLCKSLEWREGFWHGGCRFLQPPCQKATSDNGSHYRTCRSGAAFLNVARPKVPVAAAAGLARVGGEYKNKDRLALRDRKTGTLFAGL